MQIIKGINEKTLIQRLTKGDQTAFELLFRFYYPGLVVFTKQIVLDQNEAEEIVQDLFFKLWQKRDNIKECESLKGYLFKSVKNQSLNVLKHEKVKEKVFQDLKQLILNDELYHPDLFVDSELQNRIKTAFDNLPPRTREIFVMNRMKGFTNKEIAEEMNLSKRTVETQISNALKLLRIELKDYLGIILLLELLNL